MGARLVREPNQEGWHLLHLYLQTLFRHVPGRLSLLDIVSHAFMPLDLPRLLSPLAARQDYVAPPSSAPASEHSLALKHFPSFHSLLRPLLKYFEVLAAFAASSGKPWEVFAITRALSDYVSHLTELHQQYKWSAVVIYHVEFHNTRLWDMKAGDYSGWARPDHSLLSRMVYTHPLPPPSPPSGAPSSKANSSKPKKALPVEQQVCYDCKRTFKKVVRQRGMARTRVKRAYFTQFTSPQKIMNHGRAMRCQASPIQQCCPQSVSSTQFAQFA